LGSETQAVAVPTGALKIARESEKELSLNPDLFLKRNPFKSEKLTHPFSWPILFL